MQRLPNEILSYIFTHATHDYNDHLYASETPVTLSHICSRWRCVALGTGSLWTSITLTYPSSSSQFARTVASLQRSKTYPLNLFLDMRDPSWDWGDPSFDDWEEHSHPFRWQNMETILRVLIPHVSRWRKFELLTDTWAPMFTFLWYAKRLVAPKLEVLALSRCNAYFCTPGQEFQPRELKNHLDLFGGTELPVLQELSLVGVHIHWRNSNSCLRSLTSLELKYHSQEVMPVYTDFSAIIAKCPDLERLTVMGWGPRFPEDCGRKSSEATVLDAIQLPSLRRLHIGAIDVAYTVRLLAHLRCPSLNELSLEDLSCSLYPLQPLEFTPIFKKLVDASTECTCARSTSCFCSAQCPFSLGSITRLELCGVTKYEADSLHEFLHDLSLVETLSLSDATTFVNADISSLRTISCTHMSIDCVLALAKMYPEVTVIATKLVGDVDAVELDKAKVQWS